MDKRGSCANCSSTDHPVSACPTYKQGMKAIGFSLEDKDGPRCFFCNLEGHFKSDCPQFWDAVADIKHPRHEEALSGVKASKARLLKEAEARRKDKPQELPTKKMQAVTEETCEPEPVTAADDIKIDYRAAARDALNRVQQELVTKKIDQKVKLELENEKLQEKLNTFEATEVEEKAAEIKILSKEDPVPLDLLLRSNLVQQELSRMNINILSLLDKTVQVTPQVMRMLGGLLEREVTRDDPESAVAVESLTVREKLKIMPSRRQHEENERDCRAIVQQLVSSIPHEILTSTSYGRKEQGSSTRRKTVTFVDQDKEGEKVEQNLLQDCLSGETNDEKSQRGQDQHPG